MLAKNTALEIKDTPKMQGTIVQYDTDKRAGAIKGFDERRYHFSLSEWKGAVLPQTNMLVEFENRLGDANSVTELEVFVIAGDKARHASPVRRRNIIQSKSVRIHSRRTSIRLEPEMWDALQEIGQREGCTINDLCGVVYDLKAPLDSFTAALRVFMVDYYRYAGRANKYVLQVQKRIRDGNGRSK